MRKGTLVPSRLEIADNDGERAVSRIVVVLEELQTRSSLVVPFREAGHGFGIRRASNECTETRLSAWDTAPAGPFGSVAGFPREEKGRLLLSDQPLCGGDFAIRARPKGCVDKGPGEAAVRRPENRESVLQEVDA